MTRHAPAQHYPLSSRGRPRRLLVALLVVPLLVGVVGAPAAAPSAVNADELADARSQQRALGQKIADQQRQVAGLDASQNRLEGRIAQTKDELAGITQDLGATRKRVAALVSDIAEVKATYTSLVTQLEALDAQLKAIEAQEAAKKAELGERKAQLAARIRDAYEAQRTSLLETFLSGASFTDMLAQMSTQLDVAEQDSALARQIATDRETLLSLHETVDATRDETNTLRQQTAVQKHKLDLRLGELKRAQTRLEQLEAASKAALAEQQRSYAKLAADKGKLKAKLAAAAAARASLQRRIAALVAAEVRRQKAAAAAAAAAARRREAAANRPGASQPSGNGMLAWPMSGSVSQSFGCTGFVFEPPSGSCAHFHNGIDMVAPDGTPVRSSAAGRVMYVGWNYADGADPAFIVVVAHTNGLTSWYAHLRASTPVHSGQTVRRGQVIGYEGNTGHSTGAHLHWMVDRNGSWVNPALFT